MLLRRDEGRMGTIDSTPAPARTGTGAKTQWVTVTVATLAVLSIGGAAHAEYTVQPGDTLDEIAQRHGTSVSELSSENGFADPNRITAGTTISLPDESAPSTHHVVRPGQTLSAIASRYGVSVPQLAEWNGLDSTQWVMAGQRVSVAGPAAPDLATSGSATHRVAPGETLSGIAQRLGVGASELASDNGIADPNNLVAGEILTVPGRWQCPVAGPVAFVNDFGLMKPGGRFHNGVDIYAPRGTPVVAPVAGVVEQVRGSRAGLQATLHGADGHVYIGTHLDSFGASGQVQAGQTLGTVGTTGNARGTSPHLHFEIHEDGERIVNPYPSLRAACR